MTKTITGILLTEDSLCFRFLFQEPSQIANPLLATCLSIKYVQHAM